MIRMARAAGFVTYSAHGACAALDVVAAAGHLRRPWARSGAGHRQERDGGATPGRSSGRPELATTHAPVAIWDVRHGTPRHPNHHLGRARRTHGMAADDGGPGAGGRAT